MKHVYLFLIFITTISACRKNDKPVLPSEIIIAVNKANSSVNFTASFKNVPLTTVKKTGFIWGTNPNAAISDLSNSFNIDVSVAEVITYTLQSSLSNSLTYYLKAYMLDDKGVYQYSQTMSFSGSNTSKPVIQILTNGSSGYVWGDEVAINLYNTSVSDKSYVKLYFYNGLSGIDTPIPVERVENNKIYFKIPLDIKTLAVYATIYGEKTNVANIPMAYPEIYPATERFINANSILTIKGRNFNPTANLNVVKVGETLLTIVSGTTTELVVKAVDINMSVRDRLTVQTLNGLSTTTNDDYNVYKYFKRLPDFPGTARAEGVMVGHNNKIYYGLGLAGGLELRDWWQYDPVSAQWSRLPDSPVDTRKTVTFTIGADIYVGSRIVAGFLSNDLYKFNTLNNTWAKATSIPLKSPLTAVVTLTNGIYSYFIGGLKQSTIPNDPNAGFSNVVYKYDASLDKWSTIDLPADPQFYGTSFNLNGRGYVTRGYTEGSVYRNEIHELNYTTEKWTSGKVIPKEIGQFPFSFTLNGKAYLGGGEYLDYSTWMPSTFIFEYNPGTEEWIKKDRVIDYIYYGSVAASVNNKGYILGGSSSRTNGPSRIFIEIAF